MFAYCLNNPMYFVDSHGRDAVILYDSDLVGHIGALIQEENGEWWHFYWGTSNDWTRVACVFCINVSPLTWCTPYTGEIDLESINADENYGGDYEETLYLEGDFSASFEDAKDPAGVYNLYLNNCSQMTLRILSKSDTIYSYALADSSTVTMPRNAFSKVKEGISTAVQKQSRNRFYYYYGQQYALTF